MPMHQILRAKAEVDHNVPRQPFTSAPSPPPPPFNLHTYSDFPYRWVNETLTFLSVSIENYLRSS